MKALLVKSLRELKIIAPFLSLSSRKTQATNTQKDKIIMSINLRFVEVTREKLLRIL